MRNLTVQGGHCPRAGSRAEYGERATQEIMLKDSFSGQNQWKSQEMTVLVMVKLLFWKAVVPANQGT